MTGGQAVVEVLRRAGVRRVFGVPGESFLNVLDAFYGSPVEFIATRHEGGAAFMASGYAKTSGDLAVCLGTRAVGASNLAIGIHTARQDSTPMIALAGQVNRPFRGREAFQELDLVGVFSHYCKWAVEIDDAARVPELMERAVRVARSGRPGPVFVSLPEDMLRDEVIARFGTVEPAARPEPNGEAVRAVLSDLLSAARPAILAGGGVLSSPGAYDLLLRFAEATEVPVFTAWRRHDAFPNNHRLFLGTASLGQPMWVWERLKASDVLLAIGTRFQEPATRGYKVPGPGTRVIHVDIDPASIATAVPGGRGIVADAEAMLRALLAHLPSSVPGLGARRERNQVDRAAFEAATAIQYSAVREGTVDLAVVVAELGRLLPPDGIISTDAGNFYGWLSRYYRFRRPRTYIGPTSGAMGYGLPAAIGAKLGRPESPVVCLAGDGGYLMTIQELETAARLNAPVVSVVLDNQSYGAIRLHQERHHPGRVVGTQLTTPSLTKIAEAFGGQGFDVRANDEFGPALEAALAAPVPTILHVRIDPEQIAVGTKLSSLRR